MNLLDILIISTVLFFIIKGLIRGFIREIASLAGVVLGVFFAARHQHEMTEFLKQFLNPGQYLPLLSFIVIFVCVVVVCNLAGWLIRLVLKKAPLGWLDRLLGLCFALLKGVVITYLVIVVLTFFLPSGTPLIARSKVCPWIVFSYQSMAGLISPDHYQKWKQRFIQKTGELSEKIPGNKTEPLDKNE
ncbi:MAG: CvpA family protein [Desulfobacteraceae bacterium]|nr:MAG: CvpA family protein [Desulfobacteraceae bacterium]